ncbi:MAG: DUF5686 and carboxypeptidase regulatory-like domain-containing protein [Bacteroidetes bacterium]|nr:DUF5686 and carboxypeptidase regulatory-like domain-containing protein [Bacteroidota bacterium]
MKFFSCSLSALLFFVLPFGLFAQTGGIQGYVIDSKKQPIPFTSVYVPQLHKGTTANMAGEYQLVLPPGSYEVIYQYLGYQTQNKLLVVADAMVRQDIVLSAQAYNLAEVIISASGEDPAYYIMRKAISMSSYYRRQVSAYTAHVYLKGTGVALKIPALLRGQLKKEGIEPGKYFVTETISSIHYKEGEPLQTNVLSMRSSGFSNESSPMEFVSLSLYEDINGIISPLSRDAFQVYRFRLEGTFVEDGRTINKIRVIPKRRGQDLYSGTLFVREGSWNLHSVDLFVEQKMFSVKIRQVFQAVSPLVWMPVSHDYDILFEALGASVSYKYLVSVNDYKTVLNPAVDHGFYARLLDELKAEDSTVIALTLPEPLVVESPGAALVDTKKTRIETLMAREDLNNKEMRELNKLIKMETAGKKEKAPLEVKPPNTKIADSARTRTVDYWQENRQVPLTTEELNSFGEKPVDTTKADTTHKKRNKRFNDAIFGAEQRKLASNWKYTHNGLAGLSSFSFNTVDGLLYSKKLSFEKDWHSGRMLRLSGMGAYGFARQGLTASTETFYRYDATKRASISISGGRSCIDFNANQGIMPFFNTFTSLFARHNYMKLYEQDFIRIQHQIDVTNGLVFKLTGAWMQRRPLENHSDFYLTNMYGDQYSPNIPPPILANPELVAPHKVFVVDASLDYTPRHHYRMDGKVKRMLYSHYPTFSLQWRQAFDGVAGSDARYQYAEAGIRQSFDIRMIGRLQYAFLAGTFLDNSRHYFADYRHFNNDPLWVGAGDRFSVFRTLGFYENSTNTSFVEGHLQLEHSRLLIKRLPFLANSLMREKVFGNMLIGKDRQAYTEIGYGISQLFLMFNLEVVSGFRGADYQYTGIRIGIPFGETTVSF